MVCPVCITTALVANAPAIAASLGGAAAVKMCLNRNKAPLAQKQVLEGARSKQPRTIVDPLKINRYDEQDW